MLLNRLIEYVFFFGMMGIVGYLLWLMMAPFVTALALAAVIVIICYPLYWRILSITPMRNTSIAALLTTILVFIIVVLPLVWLGAMLISEALSIYKILGNGQYSLAGTLSDIEGALATLIPNLNLDLAEYLREGAKWFAGNLGVVFTGTASTIFSFLIAIVASFYFFRDGKEFTKIIIGISPLSDAEDTLILRRMSSAVRGVVIGTVLVAIIQGTLAAFGFFMFGFERYILYGVLVGITALVPGIGSSAIFLPAAGYLIFVGDYWSAAGITLWWFLAVSFIDNLLGPYLISRNHPMHPFLVLLSVLGGLILFGPIGLIVGPVITSVFLVLLEIYSKHIASADGKI